MYCGKCGKNIPDDVAFCPECGEPSAKPVKVPTPSAGSGIKLSGKTKKIIAVVLVAVIVIISLFSIKPTVNKPCEYCGHKPSVRYKTSNDSDFYVCKSCSKECAFCGKKAKKHYENYFGMIVFVCNDCYKSVVSD